MKEGTAPGSDGVVVEFYKKFWPLIGHDFLQMILLAIRRGCFPSSVIKGIISLLHKGESKKKLTNWRPITYAFECSIQNAGQGFTTMAAANYHGLVSPDQSAFLPLCFILDNLLLTMEAMAWAEVSQQPLIFLKLDFSKAYNMVD